MRNVRIELTGITPLLMHADNIDWADMMDAWKNNPKNKALSKAGDDRTPAWRWIGCLNCDHPKNGFVTIPSEYVMKSIMGGAAQVPTGKGKGTFKSLSQSGIMCKDFHFPLMVNGNPILMESIEPLKQLDSFREHVVEVEKLGFSLFPKRAKIGNAKHIRVRPRFDNWSISGELLITEPQITNDVLGTILEISGRLKGLGDWRPGAPTPGPWGMFEARVQ